MGAQKLGAGEDPELREPWNNEFTREWLDLQPHLSNLDLRGILYVSREHAPLITPEDRLSSDGAQILTAILEHPDMAGGLKDRLVKLSRTDTAVIMDRLLERARQEQEWGVPGILEACITVSEADPAQESRLAAFLGDRPSGQIKPNIVPKIADQPWSVGVFEKWDATGVSAPVKKAIKAHN